MFAPHQKPMFRFLAVLTAASMVGLQGYTILINNFAVETAHFDGRDIGLIQSVRESPGFPGPDRRLCHDGSAGSTASRRSPSSCSASASP